MYGVDMQESTPSSSNTERTKWAFIYCVIIVAKDPIELRAANLYHLYPARGRPCFGLRRHSRSDHHLVGTKVGGDQKSIRAQSMLMLAILVGPLGAPEPSDPLWPGGVGGKRKEWNVLRMVSQKVLSSAPVVPDQTSSCCRMSRGFF